MNNYILVTGGAGFIGSHFIENILSRGGKVLCIDDLSSGVNNLPSSGEIIFLEKKVENIKLHDLPSNISCIVHLAAQTSVPFSIDRFFLSSRNNLLSTIKVFSLAQELKIPVVYASSSAVYGNLNLGDELTEHFDILSPYAQDKLTMENYARMCKKVYSTNSLGLRFFNVYGPRQDPNNPYSGVISIFIDRLLKNKPIIVNGGYQTRDFIYVDDIADIIVKSIDYLQDNEVMDIFNIGTGVSVSINELLLSLKGIMNVNPEVILKKLPDGDPEKSAGNYKKLKNMFNINSKDLTGLEDGLLKTIEHFKKSSNENL